METQYESGKNKVSNEEEEASLEEGKNEFNEPG